MTALRVSSTSNNRILAGLASPDRELVEPHLEPATLNFRQRLEATDRKIERVFFLEAGLVTVGAGGGSGRRRAGIAVVGREGLIGVAAILGVDRSAHETLVQVAGHGRSIDVSVLQGLMQKSRSLAVCLMRYAHIFAVQAGHTALANAQGKIEERLARWLLMAHDRLDGDELHLTHEMLSATLGVRRAGITTALHELEKSALISTARGCVTVLDRRGLEESANGLYGVPEAEFERLFSRPR